jgi:hypothetical protein
MTSTRSTARRRRSIVAAVILIGAVGATAAVLTADDIDDGRSRTTRTTTAVEHRPLDRPPTTYRVVYRVENLAGGDRTVSTDELWVRRPFSSRLETRAGPPPGGDVSAVTISDFGLIASSGSNSEPLVLRVSPSAPNGDLRLNGVLDELVDDRGLRPRSDRDEIAGRACQVFRTGEPIGTGQLVTPTDEDYADVCIDAAGLVLSETWRVGGTILRRKVAVEVETDIALSDELFRPDARVLAADAGGGEVIALEPTSRPPATFWELDSAPEGFTHQGRFLVRPPGAPVGAQTTTVTKSEIVVDVYVAGADFVLVLQGSIDREPESDPDDRRVRLGPLKEGRLHVDVFGANVLARPDAVRYVRVMGTIEPDRLVAIAAELQPRPRGTLVPLGGVDDQGASRS